MHDSMQRRTTHSRPPSAGLHADWRRARNLLVMRLDNIGDVIMTGPALRALKEALPEARLTLMASPAGAQAAPLLPWLDDVLTWRVVWQDLGSLSLDPEREWDLVQTLRERAFDAAVILTSFSQTPHPPGFIAYLAGIPLRLGESKEAGDGILTTELPSAPDPLHQAERNLRLVESIGVQAFDRRLTIRIPADARRRVEGLLADHDIDADAPFLLLNPWTSCQARTYPPERAADAARQMVDTTGWPVVLTGVGRDRDRSAPLLEILADRVVDLVGATTVPEFAGLIARARLVLTNNTSALHLAEAVGTPMVITYSGSDYESQWEPRFTPARVLRRPTWCSPCYAFTCPYNRECLDIPPDEVAAAGLELLQMQ